MICILLQTTHIVFSNEFSVVLNASIMLMLILLFSKEFLELKKKLKKINAAINCSIVFVLLCFLYSVYSKNYNLFDQPYSLLLAPLIVMGVYIYKGGFEPAKYYVVAWGVSLALIGIGDLNRFNIVEFYPAIPFDPLGHIIESVILSYAIFVKTNLVIKEKEQQSKILIHQAKLASMGQMVENISHQWRQPLNRVATLIINIQLYVQDKYKAEKYVIDMLDQSQLQLEYMSNTINDFTHFNKQPVDKENFLVSTVIGSTYKIINKTLESNNIT